MQRPFGCVLILLFGVLASPSAAGSGDSHNGTLMPLQTSTRADGTGTVLTMAVFGDVRGMLTLDLDPTGGTGKWTLVASYVQDFNPDGTPALHPPTSEEEEAAFPVVSRQINDGALAGTVRGAVLAIDAGSGHQFLQSAQLTITSGSRTFAGAHGTGEIDASARPDGTWATNFSLIW